MKKITTLLLLFSIGIIVGQRKYTADLYFKEFAYVKAAELYQKIYQKGDSSMSVLKRLGDSYYFNFKTKQAEKWYAKLFTNYTKDTVPSIYYFRYAQSLKANRKYKESDEWMLKLAAVRSSDLRVKSLKNNRAYYQDYKVNSSNYIHVKNISLNSKYSDYISFFNDSMMVFSSTRPPRNSVKSKLYQWNKQPHYNLYKSKVTTFKTKKDIVAVEGDIVNRIRFSKSDLHDGSAVITKDGKTMYFTRDNFDGKKIQSDKKNTSHLKIYKATLVKGKWTNIEELPINDENYSVGHPALSSDEHTLYFSSDMPGGYGATDLYKVAINNNTYGTPINLGKTVNTEGKEMFPFIEKDSLLYFASDGHIGLGGLDVFKTKITKNFDAQIENLKAPINSNKDDFSFMINHKKRIGFFSSNRDGGKGDDDIYSFVVKKKKEKCNQLVEGVVTDALNKKLLPGSKVILFENDKKKDSVLVGENAFYSFTINCNVKYKLQASKRFYKTQEATFVSPNVSGKTIKNLTLEINDEFEYSNGQLVVKINPIYFDYNKSNIRTDAAIELNKVVHIMNKYPELIIRSGSHTDARGRAIYNEALSDRRAKSTVRYIVSKGIDSKRISGKGYGESQLVNDCVDNDNHTNTVKCTKEEHQLNRRTEFVVLNSGFVKTTNPSRKKMESILHVVKAKETLYSIAKKYGISVEKLKKDNAISGTNIIIGQSLKIKR